MIAVIQTAAASRDQDSSDGLPPSALMPLVDRPFIQHAIELLASQDIKIFHLLVSDQPQLFETALGTGERWGVTIIYHLQNRPDYHILKTIITGEPVLLGHADTLPPHQGTDQNAIFYNNDQWSGWVRFDSAVLKEIDRFKNKDFLEKHLRKNLPAVHVGTLQRCDTLAALLEAQSWGLTAPELILSGNEAENAIRISRNASFPPSVRFTPPVFIGADCRIGSHCRLGPNCVIGDGSVVDGQDSIQNTLIMPGSYVGPGLELQDAVVDRSLLVNTHINTKLFITEEFILGDVKARLFRHSLQTLTSRLAAFLLIGLTWPVLLLLEGRTTRHDFIRLPASNTPKTWKGCHCQRLPQSPFASPGIRHLLSIILPALPAIARGDLSFVGVQPRTADQIKRLRQDWRELYLQCKAGMITEAFINFGDQPSPDELYSAESFYFANASLSYDLKLIIRYIRRMFDV